MASWLWGRRRRLFRRIGEVNLSPAEMIKYSATSRVGHASPWLTLQQDLGQNRSLTADEDFNLGVRIWEISGLLGDKCVNNNLYQTRVWLFDPRQCQGWQGWRDYDRFPNVTPTLEWFQWCLSGTLHHLHTRHNYLPSSTLPDYYSKHCKFIIFENGN